MLQFTIIPNNIIGAKDQAEMAVNSGCQWIDIDPTDVDTDTLKQIIEICKKAGVILVYKHHDQLLQEHRVHGIELSENDCDPVKLRESLGGHPIIGIIFTPDFDPIKAKRADVDYIIIDSRNNSDLNVIDSITQARSALTETNTSFPIVITGIENIDKLQSFIIAGASGFNIDFTSLKGPDYKASLSTYISFCNNISK